MLKICIITTVHLPFDTRIFHKEAETLVNAGYAVSLVVQHDKNETVDGIKIIALPRPKNRFERMFFLTRKVYRLALEQKADIYHFHDPEFLPWAFLLKKKTNAKVIYDSHEDVPQQILSKEWIPRVLRKLISAIFNFVEKNIAKRLDAVIAVTPLVAKKFEINGAIYLANYPKLDYFNQLLSRGKEKRANDFTMIYAGGLSRIRGIREIVEAYELLLLDYDIKFKLAGNFSEKNFESEIKNLGIWKKVDYLGILPLTEVYRHLGDANVGMACLWPESNYIDSSPNKLFEYMAAGLPVVASNFSAWKKIIETNNCGFCVDPKNPRAIAKAVEYLINHPKEAQKMGENGKKAVAEKYNWHNESKKLLALYEKINEIQKQ